MSYKAKIIALLAMVLLASSAFSAGDYIWEARFKKELAIAEKGDAKAQFDVGEMYEKGKGAVKDIQKAYDWYLKSAIQGNYKAAYKVGLFFYEGTAVKRDFGKAHTWFTKSAENNYVRAQFYLGEMYEEGHGVLKDPDSALKWYDLAEEGGYSPATEAIERVKRSMVKPTKTRFLERPKAPPPPVARADTKEIILKGGWKSRNHPAEYLPSGVTNCVAKGIRVECQSKDLKRNIGMADIVYTTKAILFSFGGDNQFKISYRNNVSKINITDEDFAETGEKVPVKLGWQDAEHQLACELQDEKNIVCTKNKVRKIKLTRG